MESNDETIHREIFPYPPVGETPEERAARWDRELAANPPRDITADVVGSLPDGDPIKEGMRALGPRFIVTRHRGVELEYAHGGFGQTWGPYRETATNYPARVIADEVARVWGSYGEGWAYTVEEVIE